MTKMNPLKKALEQKIEEMIHLLELRVLINTQSITPFKEIELTKIPETERLIDRMEATYSKNQHSEAVINECNEGINKLMLIKEGIPHTDTHLLLRLFDNYFSYSIDQLYDQLKIENQAEAMS